MDKAKFLTYCNTRQFFTNKWRGEVFHNEFYLSDAELERWNVTRAQLEAMPEIIKAGVNYYNVKGVSKIDISLLKPHGRPLTDLHKFMMQCVCDADLSAGVESTAYWQAFIKHRKRFPELFFKVDIFAGRVHTSVSGMSKDVRPLLLLRGEGVVSFDVSQMQPTLLANVLQDNIGNNEFSDTINAGVDVYVMLQKKAGLQTRDEAKKLFFQMLFSKPSNELEKLFVGANFIQWINQYKSIFDDRNPHGKEKPHSNLAWILQTYEVRVMSAVWQKLKSNNIPFLTVHDEIICRQSDESKARIIIESILNKAFKRYKLNSGHVGTPQPAPQPTPSTPQPTPSTPQPPTPKKSFYAIGMEILGENTNRSHDYLINEMMLKYSISVQRATAGLTQLIENKVIDKTQFDTYFMADSTPF